jgi:hypothetical protein
MTLRDCMDMLKSLGCAKVASPVGGFPSKAKGRNGVREGGLMARLYILLSIFVDAPLIVLFFTQHKATHLIPIRFTQSEVKGRTLQCLVSRYLSGLLRKFAVSF